MYEIEPKLDEPIDKHWLNHVPNFILPFAIYWAVGFILFLNIPILESPLAIFTLNTVFSTLVGLIYVKHNIKNEKLNILQSRINKAKQDTTKAIALLNQANKHIKTNIPNIRANIDSNLTEVENLFNHKSYSLFWDMIEIITSEFIEYHQETHSLESIKNEYENILGNNKHNFPAFPSCKKITPIDGLIDRFILVVRSAQSNFEFASIWEHRKTNKLLTGGFQNLESAIYNVGSAIQLQLNKF